MAETRTPEALGGEARADGALLALAALLIAFVAGRLMFWHILPIYDDAFITWRYSMNLLELGYFNYDLGDPVLGTTAPLFGLIVAGLSTVLGPPEGFVPLLNIGIDVAICLVVHFFLLKRDMLQTAIFVCLFGVSPIAGRIAVGGMEANLFALVVLSAIVMVSRLDPVKSGVLAALGYFLRPEGAISLMICGLFSLVQGIRFTLMFSLPALAVLIVGFGSIYLYFDALLPQSMIAKSEMEHRSHLKTVTDLFFPDKFSMLMLPIALAGVAFARQAPKAVWLFFGWCAVYASLYAIAAPKVWSWYCLPIQIFLFLGASFALRRVLDLPFLPQGLIRRFLPFAAAGAVVVVLAGATARFGEDRITGNVYSGIAAFCADLRDPEIAIVADDIGAVGYHCRPARVLDTAGLVWPEAKDYRDDIEIVEQLLPDHVVFASFRWKVEGLLESRVAERYSFTSRLDKSGPPAADYDLDAMDDRWKQEYFIFSKAAE